jgi:hypothetical protein
VKVHVGRIYNRGQSKRFHVEASVLLRVKKQEIGWAAWGGKNVGDQTNEKAYVTARRTVMEHRTRGHS